MFKAIILSIALLTFVGISAGSAYASYGSVACQPIYGGGQTCLTSDKIVLDKKVLNPSSSKGKIQAFVDNLSVNDPKYFAGQNIKFELTVTNTSDSTIPEITVSDTFPSYVEFVKGSGNFDSGSKTLTFKIPNLNADESRKYIIEGKVVSADMLPSGQGVVCVVNQAAAKTGNNESLDNSQFCIERTVITTKGGIPVMDAPKGLKQTPSTGPEMLALIGLIPAGLGGLYLRKRANK